MQRKVRDVQNNDLISRAAAKKIVSIMICAPTIKIAAEHKIDDLPAVDAVSVVRCKNCMYWVETGEGIGECERFEVADSDPEITHAYQTAHDWFCADGEQADSTTCGPDYCEIGGGDK